MNLAEILWALERESIGSALFAAYLLRSMKTLTDSVVDREDLSAWASFFEEKAEGVVEECYRENPDNTRQNLIRELYFYGNSTYLELAADGDSIKFIANRSCQELLDFVWRYSLDDTIKSHEFIIYLLVGLIFPFILPQILHHKSQFYQDSVSSENNNSDNKSKSTSMKRKKKVTKSDLEISEENKRRSTAARLKIYFRKIFDFYSTPVVKFSYTIFFYLTFILYFTFLNLTGIHISLSDSGNIFIFVILVIWVISLGLEEVRQAFCSGISFKAYISDLWNKIDILAHMFFYMGTFGLIMTLCDPFARYLMFDLIDLKPMASIAISLIRFSKFSYGFSIFFFTIRILQYFSINIDMGPIIVMIQSMLSHDLGPFMTILMVILIPYGFLLWSINFEVKYTFDLGDLSIILYGMFRTVYFQLFGDLRIDILRGENNLTECNNYGITCPDVWGVWIGPILAGIYMVISSVLMLNLLIAIFSNTYDIIQSSATEYWTLERYHLMRQSSSRPPVAPPLIVLWQIYYFSSKLFSFHIEELNQFKKSYAGKPIKEKQLIQWEHMRAIDYMRSLDEVTKKSRNKGTFVVQKESNSTGPIGNVKKDIDSIRNEIFENFKVKIVHLEKRLQKVEMVDKNLTIILDKLYHLKFADGQQKYSMIHNDHEIRRASEMVTTDSENLKKSLVGYQKTEKALDNSDQFTRLLAIELQNHFLFRLVPLGNNDNILKLEFFNENDISNTELLNFNFNIKSSSLKNPHKNLHKTGKDMLPFYGENKCLHFLMSRWKRNDKLDIVRHNGKQILQVIGINYKDKNPEIPFVFVQHNSECQLTSCSTDLVKETLYYYIDMFSSKNIGQYFDQKGKDHAVISNAQIYEIYRGYVNDFRNTNNSWIETAAYNIHHKENSDFSNEFLQALEYNEYEKAAWIDVIKINWKNPSNMELLSQLVRLHDAGF